MIPLFTVKNMERKIELLQKLKIRTEILNKREINKLFLLARKTIKLDYCATSSCSSKAIEYHLGIPACKKHFDNFVENSGGDWWIDKNTLRKVLININNTGKIC